MILYKPWWTPRYAYNRLCQFWYQKKHTDHPWLNRHCISLLSSLIKNSDVGFEWGAGLSTLWFAKRMTHLTSVEHDEFWYNFLLRRKKENGINNVELFLMENDSYVFLIDRFPDGSLGFVLVDGGPRNICAIKAILHIYYKRNTKFRFPNPT